ncbi:6-bladed beta-propeller [Capnocytophaga cynodegmi]|uniref:6-bladed beta-propeller n=1 Tax=Capnocytophaga cynodegmi TaxID=28189 RepID=A0A0B7HDT0_9FLAO|nr:6-bladed beta-propeller [Capnocytophaga cynodegmi]CEN36784.1 conserved hypothetical protein [Capnocytophaga cynodegmi]
MKNIVIISAFTLTLLLGCNSNPKELSSTEFHTTIDLSKEENILYKTFSLDTLKISDIETSYIGQFSVFNDTLYFTDERFAYVFLFDKDGKFIQQYVGKGAGPNEVLGMNGAVISENDFISYNSGNGGIDIFDKKFSKQKNLLIDWQIKRTSEEILNNPIPSLSDIYEFDYGIPNILKKWDKDHISIAITASLPKFNGYSDTDLYYNYARTLALVNIHTGKVEKLVGRHSPVYLLQKNIPNFNHLNYDTSENIDEVYLNFWADKDIYLYSKKGDKVIGKFGQEGRDMKTNYRKTDSYEIAEENLSEDMDLYGRYTYLKFFHEHQIVMRGYYKGDSSDTDGLQIYKNYQLIADLNVPKGLQVVGNIDDNFYATFPQDLDTEYLVLYKIRFKE